jgi:hypothetical protein
MNVREVQTGEIWLNHEEENRNFKNNQYKKINMQNDFKTNKYNVLSILKRNNKIMNILKIMTIGKKERIKETNMI